MRVMSEAAGQLALRIGAVVEADPLVTEAVRKCVDGFEDDIDLSIIAGTIDAITDYVVTEYPGAQATRREVREYVTFVIEAAVRQREERAHLH